MAQSFTTRTLSRAEIELIWTIDRSEVIENIYYLQEGGLALQPEHYDVPGWPPGEAETYTPLLNACYDRGGVFSGVFAGARLIGVAVVDTRFIGPNRDLLQLKFLHVSRDYRRHGVGTYLFEQAKAAAAERRARGLYISATPSENTVNFYRRLGCRVIAEPDPELFALEPEDIHLECIFC
ncbi:MAG: GNAT family N-acetyltransferase [Anaerolineae bacterium]|nr:GNAT family N-acetyltransferase [Anaerolineae bacterium]